MLRLRRFAGSPGPTDFKGLNKMKTSTLTRLSAAAALLCSLAPAAFAQDAGDAAYTLDPIYLLFERAKAKAAGYEFSPRQEPGAPVADAGELLDRVPGVSINRMGGHAADIVIRGQQADQLNVIDAGSVTFGGCPNRMDPPTSSAALARADRIIVERGYSSVTNGPGGSGGTVKLERDAPEFEDGKRISGAFSTGYTDNGGKFELGGNVSVDLGGGFYVEASGEYKDAGNYDAGGGREERTAFTSRAAGLTFGYKAEGAEIALDIERNKAEDVLFSGASMDSPLSDAKVYRLRGGVDVEMGALKRIEANIFRSDVYHIMDNYSLRGLAAGGYVPSDSVTDGGKIEGQLEFGATRAKLGVDYRSNNRRAINYMGPAALVEAETPANARYLMWPDTTISQTGLYLETETALSEKTTLKGGLRYDHVRATAGWAEGLAGYPATLVPNDLYDAVYGNTYGTYTEDNLGGLLRLEHQLNAATKVFAGLSRSVRTADANERSIARGTVVGGVVAAGAWVGDPGIDPEKHHQFDLGIETSHDAWGYTATVYVDRVNDYILRDQFSSPGMTLYRNIKAELAGVELSGYWKSGNWEFAGDATYTYGENRSDDRALAQIPPLEGAISATYGLDAWRLGGRVNFATAQHRYDASREGQGTPGYAVLDLFGSYEVNDKTLLVAGVGNVFDKAYSKHLSRTNVFDTTVERVMEPGRSLYLKLETTF